MEHAVVIVSPLRRSVLYHKIIFNYCRDSPISQVLRVFFSSRNKSYQNIMVVYENRSPDVTLT